MTRITPLAAATAALIALSPMALADEVVASGTFTGASNHETTGSVQIVRLDGGGYRIELQDDFTFDGAPDPKFGFGNAGKYDKQTTFAQLESNTGAQGYDVPAGVDPAAYDQFYLWCEKFSVPLGVVSLN